MDRALSLDDHPATLTCLPRSVVRLLQANENQIKTSMDHLAFILHCLMLESGFCDTNDEQNMFKLCDKSTSVYRFKYCLSRDPEERKNCVLVLMTAGPIITAIGG